jgi:hypothetical protein
MKIYRISFLTCSTNKIHTLPIFPFIFHSFIHQNLNNLLANYFTLLFDLISLFYIFSSSTQQPTTPTAAAPTPTTSPLKQESEILG